MQNKFHVKTTAIIIIILLIEVNIISIITVGDNVNFGYKPIINFNFHA